MPEGHTIHRAAKDQRPMLKGHVLAVSSPQGRFLESATEIDGQLCLSVEAYGKHLL
jgi:endonuclease VIII